jgi:predicted RNase H-like HicB family nuclease
MRVAVYMEEGVDWTATAWALDYPGCVSLGSTPAEALAGIAEALKKNIEWRTGHGDTPPDVELDHIDPEVAETFKAYEVGNYVVRAFFTHDLTPPDDAEISRFRRLLRWSRNDLLAQVEGLTQEQIETAPPGDWSVRRIVQHVANTELLYLRAIEVSPKVMVFDDPLEQLEHVREIVNVTLLAYPVRDRNKIFTLYEERWTLRKVLRCLLRHELDHVEHIKKVKKTIHTAQSAGSS